MAVPFNNSIYSALTAIISAIMVVGIVIQVSALLVFTRKSFREIKLTALFINVTVANATILIFECPLLMVSSTQRTLWPENGIICNMRGFLCGAASINTIITFQFLVTKTMALVKNVSPSSFLGEIMLKESTMIAISWLYSMLCMLPPLLGWSSIHVDPSGLSCALDWWTQTSENIAYLVVLTIFAFCLPVSYMAYKLVSLWFYFANKQPSASDVVNRNREMYRSKMRMILLSSILYTLLWLPYCICGFLSMAGQADWFRDNAISFVPSLIAKSSCIYSPITYCIANKRFRGAFLRVLLCRYFRGGEMEVTEAELNQIHPKSNITYPANIDTNIENQPINNTWMTSGQQASGEDFQEIP